MGCSSAISDYTKIRKSKLEPEPEANKEVKPKEKKEQSVEGITMQGLESIAKITSNQLNNKGLLILTDYQRFFLAQSVPLKFGEANTAPTAATPIVDKPVEGIKLNNNVTVPANIPVTIDGPIINPLVSYVTTPNAPIPIATEVIQPLTVSTPILTYSTVLNTAPVLGTSIVASNVVPTGVVM